MEILMQKFQKIRFGIFANWVRYAHKIFYF